MSTISTSTPAATSFSTLFGAGAHAHRRAHAQLAQGVLVGDRMLGVLDDVLDCGQAAQLEAVVDDQHALQAMLVHQGLGFVQRRAFLHRDQAILRGHDVAQRLVEVSSKRRSRLVTIPTSLPPSTTGRPEMPCWRCSAMASRTFIRGVTVTGSITMPNS